MTLESDALEVEEAVAEPASGSIVSRWSAIGLAAVVLAFVGLAAVYAFSVPRFLPADETAHVGYALTLSEGDLPELDSAVPDEIPGMVLYFEIRREVYTANHPPLYYLPVAVPLRLGVWAGRPMLGFVAARLLTVAMSAVAAVGVWWAGRTLLPRRRDVALLAAAFTVLLPAVQRFSGFVYNDGFGLAVVAVAVAVSVDLLVRGPTRARLVAAAAAAVVLSLTRAVGIPTAVMVAGAAALSVVVHSPRPFGARVWRAFGAGAVVAGSAAVASGWFWLRSRHLYGDIAGSAYNLDRFGYSRRGSTLDVIRVWEWPSSLYRQLWGQLYDSPEFQVGRPNPFADVPSAVRPGSLFGILVAVGMVSLLIRTARRGDWPTMDRLRRGTPDDRGRVIAWFFVAAWCGLAYVATINYIASGGGDQGRYLFAGLPSAALLVAVAIGALPGRRRAVGPVFCVVLFAGTGLVWAAQAADFLRPADASWWEAMTTLASEFNGVSPYLLGLALGSAVIGVVGTCVSLVKLAVAEDDASGAVRTSTPAVVTDRSTLEAEVEAPAMST